MEAKLPESVRIPASACSSPKRFDGSAERDAESEGPPRKRARWEGDLRNNTIAKGASSLALRALDFSLTIAPRCESLIVRSDSDAGDLKVEGVESLVMTLALLVLKQSDATLTAIVDDVKRPASTPLGSATRLESTGNPGNDPAGSSVPRTLTVQAMSTATAAAQAAVNTTFNGDPELMCRLCSDFLCAPTTLHCGHTFCSKCLDRHWSKELPNANKVLLEQAVGAQLDGGVRNQDMVSVVVCPAFECDIQFHRPHFDTNTKLSAWLEAWFPKLSRCVQCRWKAEALVSRNHYAEALLELDEGLKIDPSHYSLRKLRAQALVQLGKISSAIDDANQCCKDQPHLAEAFSSRAAIRMESGLYSDAVSDYLRSAGLQGSLDDVLKARLMTCLEHLIINQCCAEDKISMGKLIPCLHGAVESALQKLPATSIPQSEPSSAVTKTDAEPSSDHDPDDFTCPVCLNLLYQPVTQSCGHMLCRPCIERCFDNELNCPSCRQPNLSTHWDVLLATTRVAEHLLMTYAKDQYLERKEQHDSLVASSVSGGGQGLKMPIFICVMAMPFAKMTLTIYEPQYLLMIRRCYESRERHFGMVIPKRSGNIETLQTHRGYQDWGTELIITAIKHTKSRQLLVSLRAGRRFRVLDREMKDGYNMATVEWLSDTKETGEEATRVLDLHNSVYATAKAFFTSPDAVRTMLETMLGAFPEVAGSLESIPESDDGPAWVWHCLQHLPLSEARKEQMCQSTSLTERLRLLAAYFNENSSDSAKQSFLYYLYLKRSGH
eukprot:scpid33388/ scgid12256/ LON peptidase N-terminal domain and RING finger protein 3; RING finger protein 127